MTCWRLRLRRKFSLYLSGELPPLKVKRIEDHLLDCGSCRSLVSRLRRGHQFASRSPKFAPNRDPWLALESAINAEQSGVVQNARRVDGWLKPLLQHRVAAAVFLGIAAVTLVVVLSHSLYVRNDGELIADAIGLRDYHRVSIAGIEHNTEPHVIAEGYVAEIRNDNEDGDLTFKLVDDIQKAGPFIVCEIINPKQLAAPAIGSRVRVYGVSRFDNQENHNWYEVHPVLNIEVLRR